MFSDQEVFVMKIDQLRDCCSSPTKTNMLTAAGIVRLLLLDGNPLAQRAASAFRFKLAFRIKATETFVDLIKRLGIPAPTFAIEDRSLINAPDVEVGLDKFLAVEALHAGGHSITNKDLIKYLSHIAGGVHKGRASDPKDQAIDDIAGKIELLGEMAPFTALRPICLAALLACDPAYQAINAGKVPIAPEGAKERRTTDNIQELVDFDNNTKAMGAIAGSVCIAHHDNQPVIAACFDLLFQGDRKRSGNKLFVTLAPGDAMRLAKLIFAYAERNNWPGRDEPLQLIEEPGRWSAVTPKRG